MIGVLAFYAFAVVLIVSSLLVITARNPVHSVLFLILAFFNAAGLFVLLGAEFVAMILVIVYVGAVAVLFLFVVMMLDIDFSKLRNGAKQFAPLGGFVGLALLAELIMLYQVWPNPPPLLEPDVLDVDNTKALGNVLYTQYVFPFQVSGLILLVAMIGAIVLTLRTRGGVLRQRVGAQVERSEADSVEIQNVSVGTGVSNV
ncbi:MAG: NADH-quinone oxidoreductase subunit J [Alphaproteobacteria bacterium]|nr:NADH-quinone oxidoreductase subunit J [Alphaproteobacteria bacterium]